MIKNNINLKNHLGFKMNLRISNSFVILENDDNESLNISDKYGNTEFSINFIPKSKVIKNLLLNDPHFIINNTLHVKINGNISLLCNNKGYSCYKHLGKLHSYSKPGVKRTSDEVCPAVYFSYSSASEISNTTAYYFYGSIHREFKPAYIFNKISGNITESVIAYYKYNNLHSYSNDMPAFFREVKNLDILKNMEQMFCKDGALHSVNNFAKESYTYFGSHRKPWISKSYFLFGKKYSKNNYFNLIKDINE